MTENNEKRRKMYIEYQRYLHDCPKSPIRVRWVNTQANIKEHKYGQIGKAADI